MSLIQTLSVDRGATIAQISLSRASGPAPRRDRADAALAGSVLHVQQDGQIYREGDDARHFYKVVSGVVRTCKFFRDGRRQIDAFYAAGDLFGFETEAFYELSAEAVSDCVLVAYRRSAIESDDQLAGQILSYALHSLARSQAHAMLLGRCSAMQKMATFLLESVKSEQGREVVDLAMTRQDIADYLGLTIETVSRTMTHFERDGVIALPTARRVWILDRAALADYVN